MNCRKGTRSVMRTLTKKDRNMEEREKRLLLKEKRGKGKMGEMQKFDGKSKNGTKEGID